MKKFYFILFASILPAITVKAQVIFYEDFNHAPGVTSAFPDGWLIRNVDNNLPSDDLSFTEDAWARKGDFSSGVDSYACSTSWYTPSGTADDWMWTPEIVIPTGGTVKLTWRAKTKMAYPDGYEVRIMTKPDMPTGGLGVLGNQLDNSTLLFTTEAEYGFWIERNLDLTDYAGDTVRIAFRNNTFDGDLLYIDNIKVEKSVAFDAGVLPGSTSQEYSMLPLSQAPEVTFSKRIRNYGTSILTNLRLGVSVSDEMGSVVYTAASAGVIPVLELHASILSSAPAWNPTEEGNYTIKYYTIMEETDSLPYNDTLVEYIAISDSSYARDRDTIEVGLGLGENGYAGQSFTLDEAARLNSISIVYTIGYTGEKYAAAVFSMQDGRPDAIIATTDTLLYENNDALFANLGIHGGPVLLEPGTYMFAAIEFDSLMGLAMTDDIFTPGTTWISFSSDASGTWYSNENFGAEFSRPYVIRPNLLSADEPLPVELVSFNGRASGVSSLLKWEVSGQTNITGYEMQRSEDGRNFSTIGTVGANSFPGFTYRYTDFQPLPGTNYYRLLIREEGKHSYSRVVTVQHAGETLTRFIPNPTKGIVRLESNDHSLVGARCEIFDLTGRLAETVTVTSLPTIIDIANLPAGTYLLILRNAPPVKIVKE